jgi:STE24 endopeptidase
MNGGKINNESGKEVKSYNKTKIVVSLINTLFVFIFLAILVFTGLSKDFAVFSNQVTDNAYLSLLIFTILLIVIETVITLPLSYYSGYHIEHKYNLSNQSFLNWIWENVKSGLLGLAILLPLLLVFLYILKNEKDFWWFWVGAVLFFFSVVLARLAPVLIMPLFYKFKPIENESLKNRIAALCVSAGVEIKGIFSFNLSKETKKANAGFTGIGKSKRIIISDTLIQNFSEEEIETVFAHELGHYKHHHIWKGMVFNTTISFLGLYLVSVIYKYSIPYFHYSGIDDIAAFPLIALLLSIYGFVLMPLTNAFSRMHEKEADSYAMDTTNNFNAFSSTMNKLAELNLSDKEPNKFIEMFFYSHPSITNRIKFIKEKFKIND